MTCANPENCPFAVAVAEMKANGPELANLVRVYCPDPACSEWQAVLVGGQPDDEEPSEQ